MKCRHHHIAVADVGQEALGHLVGDLLRAAGERPVAAGATGELDQFTQRPAVVKAPAWNSTGQPCGGRWIFSGPLTSKNLPWKSVGRISELSPKTPLARSIFSVCSSQLSQSRLVISTNSAACSYRTSWSGRGAAP